ncbi:MAG: glycosyltransferase family 2 protein [Pseudomonadota bacterium]
MTKMPDGGLAVITVSYGTSELVLTALPALLDELGELDQSHVFLIDNLSPNDDGAKLAKGVEKLEVEGVTFIQSPVNGGFAAGNNLGFRAIAERGWAPEAVLLLNPDAEVRPGAISEMLRVLRATPSAGFVGPRLENTDGTTWVGAFTFPTLASEVFTALGLDVFARHFRPTIPDTDIPTRADWITGTATLIRYETLLAIGEMDQSYFLYYEEVDYMLAGARAGWESWHAPDALVRHIAGAATGIVEKNVRQGRMPDYWFQSWARYFSKNHGAGYARLTAALLLIAMLLGDLQRWIRGRHAPRPQRYYLDFIQKILFARLSPPPASDRAQHIPK